MPISNLLTLDQLESAEYVYRLVSAILPSLCLDYKVNPALFHSYVHAFDVAYTPALGELVDKTQLAVATQQLGINYMLRSSDNRYFPASITHEGVHVVPIVEIGDYVNPVSSSHSFSDMPTFTRHLLKIRTASFEAHARFFGGYVPSSTSPAIKSPVTFPTLSFENTYLASLMYPTLSGNTTHLSTFRARMLNGVIIAKDLANLLGVRALLTQESRVRMDRDYGLEQAAQDHGIVIAQNPQVDTELTTMSLKHLALYYQHFVNVYDLGDLFLNGEPVVSRHPIIASYVASLHYQKQIGDVKNQYKLRTQDHLDMQVYAPGGAIAVRRLQLDGVEFVILDSNIEFTMSLLALAARGDRVPALTSEASLFWDGIPYEEYASMKLADVLFHSTTCYVFALFEHNNVTYCSLLSDVIAADKVPQRVCFLPRIVGGKTAPKLIAEVLSSINAMSPRDFPRHTGQATMHVGLSDKGFMRFFQILRLLGAQKPEVAIKEVLMAYAGIKLSDSGSPHHICKDSYQPFIMLLFGAMGFRVSMRKSFVSSHKYTSFTITPRVTRQYITNMLTKSSCSKQEAEKLMASAHDLLSFMLSVGNTRSPETYRFKRWGYMCGPAFGPVGMCSTMCGTTCAGDPGADATEDLATTVHLADPAGLLERIDVKNLMLAQTLDEMVDIDAFRPENSAFKANVERLIESGNLSGEALTNIMPLNLLDRFMTTAGASFVSLSSLMDNIGNASEDCDTTNEVVEIINAALRDNYAREAAYITSHAMNSVTANSEKQMSTVRQSACRVAMLFKNLAMSIYSTERMFNMRISDEVKADLLEKYKVFVDLSRTLYMDLIAMEHLKALMFIVRRSGRSLEETEISADDVRKSYDLIKPKVARLVNYYTDMCQQYFSYMKKNLNMQDPSAVTFRETE